MPMAVAAAAAVVTADADVADATGVGQEAADRGGEERGREVRRTQSLCQLVEPTW